MSIAYRRRLSLKDISRRYEFHRCDIGPVPPAAAEREEKRDRVAVTIGSRLDEADQRLLIGLLRIEHREIIDVAEVEALPDDGEASIRGAFGVNGLLQGDRIDAQRGQGVRNVLKCRDHSAAILRFGLLVG